VNQSFSLRRTRPAPLTLTAFKICRLVEGKTDERSVNMDTLGLMKQLGAVLVP
jgi:hypothetical protein